MLAQFATRSYELEHLDKGDYTSDEYAGCLVELRWINRFLGDAAGMRRSLWSEVERNGQQKFSVLDVGAGSGELLRITSHWARSQHYEARLVGLELNASAARAIKDESEPVDNISSVRGNVFLLPFGDDSFDYVICSLFAHHFRDSDLIKILREFNRVAKRRLFIIDLHRHPVAYFLYKIVSILFLRNRLTREDGALSIHRGFLPDELRHLAIRAGLEHANVSRVFPYHLVLSSGAGGSK